MVGQHYVTLTTLRNVLFQIALFEGHLETVLHILTLFTYKKAVEVV